jgi:hypothetical protein
MAAGALAAAAHGAALVVYLHFFGSFQALVLVTHASRSTVQD